MSNQMILPRYYNFCPDMKVLLKPSQNQMALHLSESWFVSKKATKVRSGTVSLLCLKQHNIRHCSPWVTSLWPHFCQARPTFIVIMGQWQAQVTIALKYLNEILINTIFEMFLSLIFKDAMNQWSGRSFAKSFPFQKANCLSLEAWKIVQANL